MSLPAQGAGGFTVITADTADSNAAADAQWKATLAQWEARMLSYGQIHCQTQMTKVDRSGRAQVPDSLLAMTFYDAMQVYLQIWQYTKDPSWKGCAKAASDSYRDAYVLRSDLMGQVPGYWNFTTGLAMDYELNRDETSKRAVILLSQRGLGGRDDTILSRTVSANVSREIAYSIRSHLHAEKLGESRRTRTTELVTASLGHIDQWFVSKSYRPPVGHSFEGVYYIQPFMVGITMEALIMWYEVTHDPRVPPAIKICLDWLWANAWVPADRAFWYQNHVTDPNLPFPAKKGASDLNMLIAPAYAWYYMITGDVTYRDQGDQAFAGSVDSYIAGAKQFNQNYSYGFQYVSRRLLAEGGSSSLNISSTPLTSGAPSTPQGQTSVPPTGQAPAIVPATPEVTPNVPPSTNPPRKNIWRSIFGK